MTTTANTRALAATVCQQIIDHGQSLDRALTKCFNENNLSDNDRGFVQEIVYGATRWYWQLDDIAQQLLKSPIRNKERVIHFVLVAGLYQLIHMQTAEHAAVSESVNACQSLNKAWAKKLINGCLRNFLRAHLSAKQPCGQYSHPQWLIDGVSKQWPQHAEHIFAANNQHPPMCLRVNQIQSSRDDYLAQLTELDIAAQADKFSAGGIILLKPVPVSALPGFNQGAVSVQDTAAQISCALLQPETGHRILDACAAPGGKAAHILEATNNRAKLIALDNVESRCQTMRETFARLKLNAEVHCVDAGQPATLALLLTTDEEFDRILVDAPCSGSGVIRRHPDIKHHRRPTDIENNQRNQEKILRACWPQLKVGGKLLYTTCSVFAEENHQQIAQFLSTHPNAKHKPIDHPNAIQLKLGVQTLPGVHEMDGFYYCLLEKNA